MNTQHTTPESRILLQKAFNVTFKLQTTCRTSPRIFGSPLLPIPQERPSTRTSHPRGPRGEARAAAEFQFQGIRPVKHPHPSSLLEHTAEPREGGKGSILSSPVVQRFLFRRPPMYILFDAFAPPVGLPLRRRRVLCCPWWPPCYYYIRLLLRLRQLPPPLSPPPPPLLLLLLRRRYFKCFPICGMAHLSTHLRRSK